MSVIKVEYMDQVLNLIDTPTIAAGGVDTDSISFITTCSEWDDFGLNAIFYRSDDDTKYKTPILEGKVTIPHEVLYKEGTFFFGIAGTKVAKKTNDEGVEEEYEQVKTSQMIPYKIVKGAAHEGSKEHLPPTANEYTEIMDALGRVETNHPYIEFVNENYNYEGTL